jgi:ribonucleoside-diphosphate reductase alpha chain
VALAERIRRVGSIDYIFCWLGLVYVPGYGDPIDKIRVASDLAPPLVDDLGRMTPAAEDLRTSWVRAFGDPADPAVDEQIRATMTALKAQARSNGDGNSNGCATVTADAPLCENCGALTVHQGKCFLCFKCGSQIGNCGG